MVKFNYFTTFHELYDNMLDTGLLKKVISLAGCS